MNWRNPVQHLCCSCRSVLMNEIAVLDVGEVCVALFSLLPGRTSRLVVFGNESRTAHTAGTWGGRARGAGKAEGGRKAVLAEPELRGGAELQAGAGGE